MSSGGRKDENLEIEVKVRIGDPAPVISRLESIGGERIRERHLEENFLLDYPELLITRRGCLLRVRRTPGKAFLTFKGSARVEQGAKVRPEREVLLEDAGVLIGILEGIGLRVCYRYEKFRAEYELSGLHIAVDELPFGNFLELEGPQDAIRTVAGKLGFVPGQFLTDSYRSLHQAHADRIGEPMGDLLFPK